MTHYQISMKNEADFDKKKNSKWLWYVSTWPSSCAEKLKEITWQAKGKCSYKEPYFCKWTIKKARVSLFAWGSSLTAWYVALALSSSSVLSEEKKKETRAQPLSRHFLTNNKSNRESFLWVLPRFLPVTRVCVELWLAQFCSALWNKSQNKKSEFAFLLIGHFRVRKPSLSKWGQVYNLSCENEFYSNDNENPFHIKGWALNLVLIQRFGGTRKWPN